MVAETVADAADGDGDTRRQFAEAGRTLIAKVSKPPPNARFTKQDFQIDLPVIRDFYAHSCLQSKPRKVTMVAAMRKLILILNIVLQD